MDSALFLVARSLPFRHGFTLRSGGVSTGKRASLDLGPAGDAGPDVRRTACGSRAPPDCPRSGSCWPTRSTARGWSAAGPASSPRPTRCGPTRPVSGSASGPRTASPSSSAARTAPGSLPSTPDGGEPSAASPRRRWHAGGRGPPPRHAPRRHRPMHRCLLLRGGGGPGGRFAAAFGTDVVQRPGPRPHLDLRLAVRRTLQQAGVEAAHIEDVAGCTACDAVRFFSHRRDRGGTGRHLAFIAPGALS